MEVQQQPQPRWFQEQVLRLNDKNVTNINLNLRRVSVAMIVALAEALKDNSSIQVINLTSCLTMAALQHPNAHSVMLSPLAMAVEQSSSLCTLHLSYNRLLDAPSLARSISCRSTLVEVHLDHNQLNEQTAVALSETLATNTSLQVLNLDYNRIGDVGGVAIAQALQQNSTLRTLGLKRNNLGVETSEALLDLLQTNMTLHRLSLQVNPNMPVKLANRCLCLTLANRHGRHLLHGRRDEDDMEIDDESQQSNSLFDRRSGVWANVLARASSEPDVIFFFLMEKPSLLPSKCDR